MNEGQPNTARPRRERPGATTYTILFSVVILCLVATRLLWQPSEAPPLENATEGGPMDRLAPPPSFDPVPSLVRISAAPEGAEHSVTLVVKDAATGALVEQGYVLIAEGTRTIRRHDARTLGGFTLGTATLDWGVLQPAKATSALVVESAGYVPAVVQIPPSPGTYDVRVQRGRKIRVTVETPARRPVAGASVIAFAGNVDRALLDSPQEEVPFATMFSMGQGAWYLRTVTGPDGTAEVTVPKDRVTVTAERLGWFLTQGYSDVAEEAVESPGELRLEMQEVFCVALATRSGHILGRTFATAVRGGWHEATNASAFHARDRVVAELGKRFPGDISLAECLLPGTGGPTDPSAGPEVRLGVLVEQVGRVDLAVHLRPFTQASLEYVPIPHDTASHPWGTLEVLDVAGYELAWPTALFAVLDETRRDQLAFDLRYGEKYRLAAGRYRVFQRQVGSPGKTEVGVFDVQNGGHSAVSVSREQVRWPTELAVADEGRNSPAMCTLTIRRAADSIAESQRSRLSPRDPRRFLVFLEEGEHEVMASSDGVSWDRSLVVIWPTYNRVGVKLRW